MCTSNTRLRFPKLYSQTLDTFNVRIFWIWVLNAIMHSFLLFWICMFAMKHEVVWSNGKEGGYLLMGNCIYTVRIIETFSNLIIKYIKLNIFLSVLVFQYVVIVVCLKAGLHIQSWSFIVHIAIWGSIALWFVFLVVYRYECSIKINLNFSLWGSILQILI